MPRAGEIWSACSRAEVARTPAGAWFGEQVRKPIRAWIANLRYVGTSAMRRRSDYWAILKGNPLHGARSRRGQPTVILAARTGLANYPNKYDAIGLLLHSSRLAWTGTDQTNHRSSGAARREAWCYRDRSVSRRSKLPQLSLYGIRTDVRIGRILRGWPSWNASACLAPRIAQVAWSASGTKRTWR